MGRKSKRARLNVSANAIGRETMLSNKKHKSIWKAKYEDLERRCEGLFNPKGTVRSIAENRLFVFGIKVVLGFLMQLAQANLMEWKEITWTKIRFFIAENFKVAQSHVADVLNMIMEGEHGYVLEPSSEKRGAGSESYPSRSKLTPEQLLELAKYVDQQHSKGRSVSKQKLINWVRHQYNGLEVSKTTVGRYLKKLGLTYRPTKPRKRTLQSYRLTCIRDFLLNFNQRYNQIQNGENFVFVFMDESYVHNSHSLRCSWVPKDNHINKSASKGKRLIIIHAISVDGPLTEVDQNGKPIDDLEWKGKAKDTCSSKSRQPNDASPINCETLWIAQQKTGDYHDNMTSELFLKWVEQKLLPCFERLFPDKKMILIADNAPYHHSREIGSLSGMKKEKLIKLMQDWDCDFIEIPVSEARTEALEENEIDGVTDAGSCFMVEFDIEEFNKKASARNPFVPTVEELQLGFAKWLKDHKPHALRCKVEMLLMQKGHDVLWTPPYCPDLQPIEIVWAIGKNNVASQFYDGRNMKETVKHLRDGWYGNFFGVGDPPDRLIHPANCKGLINKSITAANDIFIPMCKELGLSGSIGHLLYNPPQNSGEEDTHRFPIDLVVGDLGMIARETDENGRLH